MPINMMETKTHHTSIKSAVMQIRMTYSWIPKEKRTLEN